MRSKTIMLMAVFTGLLLAMAAFAPTVPDAFARDRDARDRGIRDRDADEVTASDDREYSFTLGIVTEDQGWTILLNESTRVRITSDTELFNAREKEIGRGSVRSGSWIYIEGPIAIDGAVEADKVYLLPGPVKTTDYRKYPFIKIAPGPWRP